MALRREVDTETRREIEADLINNSPLGSVCLLVSITPNEAIMTESPDNGGAVREVAL